MVVSASRLWYVIFLIIGADNVANSMCLKTLVKTCTLRISVQVYAAHQRTSSLRTKKLRTTTANQLQTVKFISISLIIIKNCLFRICKKKPFSALPILPLFLVFPIHHSSAFVFTACPFHSSLHLSVIPSLPPSSPSVIFSNRLPLMPIVFSIHLPSIGLHCHLHRLSSLPAFSPSIVFAIHCL